MAGFRFPVTTYESSHEKNSDTAAKKGIGAKAEDDVRRRTVFNKKSVLTFGG